jgi:lipopolysaccharide biosynthesis regulator YciM
MLVEILIGVACLVVGYALGRTDWSGEGGGRGRRRGRAQEGLAYIKGVNYILSDAPDLAIEEFIKAVQINSETVETYLALGSLFRSKGDVTRAIRIHQGIVCRPQLEQKILVQALCDLGLDYRKAGFVDRAIATFQEVIAKDPKMVQAYVQLEDLFEETKDWEAAFHIQEKLSRLRRSDDAHILAHLMTELGKSHLARGDVKGARGAFKRAISIDGKCVDAYLHFGDLFSQEGQDAKAVGMWKKVMTVVPAMTFLAYDRLEHAFFRMGQVGALEELLRERSAGEEDLFTRIFLAKHLRKKGETEEAIRTLRGILDRWPDSGDARRELIQIYLGEGMKDEAIEEFGRLMETLSLEDRHFQCRMCGYRSDHLVWKCPQCLRWDTMGSPGGGSLHGEREV